MATVLRPDAFNATLLESPPLDVTLEQQGIIKKVLELACSDSRFAQKAYDAIWHVLTVGPTKAPEITSVSPNSAALGSPSFTLTVTGKEFNPFSKVLFNGAAVASGFTSQTELSAIINMSGYITPGRLSVGVLNNDVLSNLVPFTITAGERKEEDKREDRKEESVLDKIKAMDTPKDKILESKKASDVLDRK